jgi:hypothetical protein
MTKDEFQKFEKIILEEQSILLNNKFECKIVDNESYENKDWIVNEAAKTHVSKEIKVQVSENGSSIYDASIIVSSNLDFSNDNTSRYSISLFTGNKMSFITEFSEVIAT